jgi:phage shock protein A
VHYDGQLRLIQAYGDCMPDEPTPSDPGYDKSGVPSFDSVREKIETRYGTSLGQAELDAETPEGRTVEEQYEARQKAAGERLEQIRESMHPGKDDQ